MHINIYRAPISDAEKLVKSLLHREFEINADNVEKIFNDEVKQHFAKLKDTIYLVVETSYVDKVYRDSYYHYYSSKLTRYKRECIRISLFEGKIRVSDFLDGKKIKRLQDKYRGFIVLRPTGRFVIGRSIVSPKALKDNSFLFCSTKFSSTVNGIKLTVDGFPHSSQDTETISCAETTLWAIMEYFSNKYSNYMPTLPSKIIGALNKVSYERQVPSKGLNIMQMSFALKEFGFGTRVYSREDYADEFERLLSCYTESGIPLIVAWENIKTGNIKHAVLVIGREKIDSAKIDAIGPTTKFNEKLQAAILAKNITIFDYDNIKKDFIFIDDNKPAYQRALLEKPAAHYDTKEWRDCKITYFIAPLYPKIYLEAFEARNYVMEFLTLGPEPLKDNSEILLRIYLASSRSFKNKIAIDGTLKLNLKHFILEAAMPKFIWVAEISTKEHIKNQQVEGIVILDATEADIYFNKPLIMAAYQDKYMIIDEKTGKLNSNALPLQKFSIYENNLNAY